MKRITTLFKAEETLQLISSIITEAEDSYASLRFALLVEDYAEAISLIHKINGLAIYLDHKHLLSCNDLFSFSVKEDKENCFVLLKKSYGIWLDARLDLELDAFNIREFIKPYQFSKS